MILLANARFKKKNWYILLISLIAIYSCQNFPEKVSADHHISEVKKIDRNVIWTAMKRFQFSLIVDEIIQLHILFKVMDKCVYVWRLSSEKENKHSKEERK